MMAAAHNDVAAPWSLGIVIASLWLAVKAVAILRPLGNAEWRPMLRRAFVQVNAYALVVMVCLSLNSLVS